VQRWAFCEHGNEDSDAINSGNFLTSWAINNFKTKTLQHSVIIVQFHIS
jgi:hypothetical protein